MSTTSKTIAVFGAGPGLGRSVARRFGRDGFRVALVARTRAKLDVMVGELAADGVEAGGFVADLADRQQLSGVVEAITGRFGRIDVLEYAPAGPEWMQRQVDIRACDPGSFEFGLNMLLRTPAALVESVLPGMLDRGEGRCCSGGPPKRAGPCNAGQFGASITCRVDAQLTVQLEFDGFARNVEEIHTTPGPRVARVTDR